MESIWLLGVGVVVGVAGTLLSRSRSHAPAWPVEPPASELAPEPPPPDPEATRLKAVLEGLEQPLYVTDGDGGVILANRACYRHYSMEPGGSLTELQRRIDLAHREPDLMRFVEQVFANPNRSVVSTVASPDRHYKVYSAPLQDGRVVIYQDVTLEQRFAERLEREVAEQTARLRETDLAKNRFIANMSHELRTPLNHVVAYASSLQDGLMGPVSADQDRALDKILVAAERLLALINDVLDLSKLEAQAMEIDRQLLDPVELVSLAYEFHRAVAERKGVELEADWPDALPLIVGDALRIQQVLSNLLSNALKFTPPGGRIRLSAALLGNEVCFTVADTGIGIDPAHHERLFERFYMADDSPTRPYGGTGLGLSISRQLVELHGGRIWVESAPSEGARFHFTLPVAD